MCTCTPLLLCCAVRGARAARGGAAAAAGDAAHRVRPAAGGADGGAAGGENRDRSAALGDAPPVRPEDRARARDHAVQEAARHGGRAARRQGGNDYY